MPQSALAPAGPEAEALVEMAWVLFVGAGAIFVFVMALLAWSLAGRRAGSSGAWIASPRTSV